MSRAVVLFLFLAILQLGLCSNADSGNESRYSHRIEASVKGGNARKIARGAMLMPLLQKQDRLVFASVIGMLDNKKAFEGNFGIGYRQLFANHILGVYGFYDYRRTVNNFKVQQATLGFEVMYSNLEFRVNGYLPDEKLHSKNLKYPNKKHNFNNIFTTRINETAMKGFDIEVGGNFPGFDALQAFASYYYFTGKNAQKNVSGFRGRMDFSVFDWLKFNAEISHDTQKEIVYYAGFTLSYSFSKNNASSLTRLEQKMTNIPVRDVDVVTDRFISNIEHFNVAMLSGDDSETAEWADDDDAGEQSEGAKSTDRDIVRSTYAARIKELQRNLNSVSSNDAILISVLREKGYTCEDTSNVESILDSMYSDCTIYGDDNAAEAILSEYNSRIQRVEQSRVVMAEQASLPGASQRAAYSVETSSLLATAALQHQERSPSSSPSGGRRYQAGFSPVGSLNSRLTESGIYARRSGRCLTNHKHTKTCFGEACSCNCRPCRGAADGLCIIL